jgi:hypothetical protein
MQSILSLLLECGCPTAKTFCCGCTVVRGVYIILGFHLLDCLVKVVAAFMALVFHIKGAESVLGLSTQLWITGVYLAGIPIIAIAYYGAWFRRMREVYIYLIFLEICCLIDWVTLYKIFIATDPCKTFDDEVKIMGADLGEAFTCGITRLSAWAFVVFFVSIQLYAIFTVWSYCGGVKMALFRAGFTDLSAGTDEATKFKRKHLEYGGKPKAAPMGLAVGIPHHKVVGPYPSPYGAVDCTLGGPHNSLYSGEDHALDVPGRENEGLQPSKMCMALPA